MFREHDNSKTYSKNRKIHVDAGWEVIPLRTSRGCRNHVLNLRTARVVLGTSWTENPVEKFKIYRVRTVRETINVPVNYGGKSNVNISWI
jgi:hypothetical protein